MQSRIPIYRAPDIDARLARAPGGVTSGFIDDETFMVAMA
jgi:hypothetical protein